MKKYIFKYLFSWIKFNNFVINNQMPYGYNIS